MKRHKTNRRAIGMFFGKSSDFEQFKNDLLERLGPETTVGEAISILQQGKEQQVEVR